MVVVGRAPATAAGQDGDDSVVAALLKHPRLERASDAEAGAAAVADLAGHATGEVPLLVRRKGVEAVALVTGAFPDARTLPGDANHVADPARYADHSTVTVRAPVVEAEIWNPGTGTRHPAQVTVSEGRSTIEVPLEGAPAVLVVWREGTPQTVPTPAPTPAPERTIDLSHGWEGRLVPTMDNTWGDLALPAGSSVAEPQIWKMSWTETDGPDASWEQTRATYGNRVRVLPHVSSAEAPDPLDATSVERVLAGELPLFSADLGWRSSLYSSSRGIPDPDGLLGNKGLVTEEFVRVPVPGPGTVARVRSIVETDHRGPAELHIGAAATKRVWWNGERLDTGTGYLATARVRIGRTRNVLEYELGEAQDRPLLISGTADTPLGSYFCLTRPDGFGPRPQFMCLPEDVRPSGGVTYRGRLNGPGRAVLVVGAAVGVTVLLDGAVVARQEKVEYYESDWGAVPMFFQHQLALVDGEHVLEVVADAVHPREAVFVDCVARTESAVNSLVSGSGWEAETGEWRGGTVEHEGRWGSCSTATRPYDRTRCRTPSGSPARRCSGPPCCRCVPRTPSANTPSVSASPCLRAPNRWNCHWSCPRGCGSATVPRRGWTDSS